MPIPRLLRTVSFRLVALYVLIFGASVSGLAGVTYFVATAALDAQIRSRIEGDAAALRDEYTSGGMRQLLQAVAERRRGRLKDGLVYAVFQGGHRLFGTLPASTLVKGWSEVRGPPDGDEPVGESERLATLAVKLPGDAWVVVADDIGRVAVMGGVILRTLAIVLALSITVAVAGGIMLSRGFLRRVEAITNTAEAIIAGDVRRRVPRRDTVDDLDRLAATLNRMLDRIGELMETLHQVSNDIAHDLRTPLGRLQQGLEEVRRLPRAAPEYEAAIDEAIAESQGLLETFGALLRIAQIETGTRKSGFASVDLSAVVDMVWETYVPVAEDDGRQLVKSSLRGVTVRGDRELLAQMLINLVENAITHTSEGTRIEIALRHDANGIDLDVADNGPGVPPEERERIFKRFYRLEPSRHKPGSGLGLSLVAAIANLHGIHLDVADNGPGLRIRAHFAAPDATTAVQSVNSPELSFAK